MVGSHCRSDRVNLISSGKATIKSDRHWKPTINNGRFPLPIRLTRSSPIKRSGTGRARSTGVVGVVYLARHRSGFLPENFGHVRKLRVDQINWIVPIDQIPRPSSTNCCTLLFPDHYSTVHDPHTTTHDSSTASNPTTPISARSSRPLHDLFLNNSTSTRSWPDQVDLVV